MFSTLLLFKLLVMPLIVVAISYAQKRWSDGVAGIISGLPLVMGPISVFLAIEQGLPFAREATAASAVGAAGLFSYVAVYVVLARKCAWYVCWPLGMAACGLVFYALSFFTLTPVEYILCGALAALAGAVFVIRKPCKTVAACAVPNWDIPLRALAVMVLVVLITVFAPVLGPKYSGVLSQLPMLWGVMFVFTHTRGGYDALASYARGAAIGYFGFISFCIIVAFAPINALFPLYLLAFLTSIIVNLIIHKNSAKLLNLLSRKQSVTA